MSDEHSAAPNPAPAAKPLVFRNATVVPEKTEKEGLLGVSLVRTVSPVIFPVNNTPNEPDKQTTNKTLLQLFSDEGFIGGKKEQTKIAILLYDYRNGLGKEEISKLATIGPDNVYVYTDRLKKLGWITTLSPKPYRYLLTDLGRAEIEKLYFDYQHTAAEQQREILRVEQETTKYEQTWELADQIAKFQEFFAVHERYMQDLLSQIRAGRLWVVVDFYDLSKFCPELAELLLEKPDEVLKAWQIAIERMNLPRDDARSSQRVHVRVRKLPETTRLSSLSTEQVDRLVQVEAQVLTVSERRPQMASARFECPSCGNVLYVLQAEQKYKEPSRCGCGRKGKFKLLSSELVAACSLLLVQPLTELVGKKVKPSQLKVFLKNDLTNDDVRDHLGLNGMVRIVGTLLKVPVLLREGGQSTRFDLCIEAVSVQLMDHYNPQLALSPERVEQIKKDVASPNFKEQMIQSFFPRHIGDENLKLQFLCMSVAMPLHLNSIEAKRQAECEVLNIIVAGDPGMGKSHLGSRVLDLAPHGGRATGAGASKAGLTIAADSKDKENDLVIPQPGAIPSANMGIFLLDELDKMDLNEQTVLNEVLSERTVTATKRGVNLTLPAMECFIGFANPRVKTWNLSETRTIQNELNIHYSLLTRCIINVQEDKADEEKDREIARAVLNKDQAVLTSFDDQYIRDYLLYVRGTVHPKMRDRDKDAIEEMYTRLRRKLPLKALCPRFVEQVRSLSLLHAKLHLRNETRQEDIAFAESTLLSSLSSTGYESAALKVKEIDMTRDEILACVRAQNDQMTLFELRARFPQETIQRLLRDGQLNEWKAGLVRVNE